MSLFSFRMKDGDSVIVYATDKLAATEILKRMGVQSNVASVRQIATFAATFVLSDNGDLQTTLLHPATLDELAPDYPLLGAARAHSYVDFGASSSDGHSKPVLFNEASRQHTNAWDQRDKNLIDYAVQQERERLSN